MLNYLKYLERYPEIVEKEKKYWTDYYNEKINKCEKIINLLKSSL